MDPINANAITKEKLLMAVALTPCIYICQALDESRESADNIKLEKCVLMNEITAQLGNAKSREQLQKLMDLESKLQQLEKFALCNEFKEKISICQKKVRIFENAVSDCLKSLASWVNRDCDRSPSSLRKENS